MSLFDRLFLEGDWNTGPGVIGSWNKGPGTTVSWRKPLGAKPLIAKRPPKGGPMMSESLFDRIFK